MKKDYIYTIITQLIVLLSFLLSYKFIASNYGNSSFEEFSIIKRDIAFFMAFIGLGLYTSIIRYSAIYKNEDILKSSFLFTIILFLILFLMLFAISGTISFEKIINFLFKRNLDTMVYTIFLTIFGMYLHNVVYAYLRGKLLVNYLNIFDIYNKAFAPFVALLFSHNLENFFLIHGVYQLTNSFVVYLLLSRFNIFVPLEKFIVTTKLLLNYGIKRIGADFGLNIVLILPILFSNENYSGIIAFVVTLLTVTGYAYSPLGLVLLPRVTKAIDENNTNIVKKYINIAFFVTLFTSIVLTLFIFIFKDYIFNFFINNSKHAIFESVSLIFITIIPYTVYLVNKNILDAYFYKGINSINIIISILIYFIIMFINSKFGFFTNINKGIMPFIISIYYLGISTSIFLFYMYIKVTNNANSER